MSFMKYIKVAAQYESDSDNFRKLGVPNKNIVTTGSIKFDINVKSSVLEYAKSYKSHFSKVGKDFVWIAASTHDGEEEKYFLLIASY